MAGERAKWWPLKLQLLEANYERCKLKIRQDSLHCKLFIIQLQNALDEERFITQKYETKVVSERLQNAEQQVASLTKEKEIAEKKAVEDLSSVEGEWKAKAEELVKKIESLQEEKENEIKSKDIIIVEITKELEALRSNKKESKDTRATKNYQEQLSDPSKLDRSEENGGLHDNNCQVITSNSIEAQNSKVTVLQKAKNAPEGGIGNYSSSENEKCNLVFDDSEKPASINGEKLLESEVGSVLEITEEMLKSCRKRSVLKRKKSEFSDFEHRDEESGSVDGCIKQDKKRKERRVTFSDELEIKLPDGSKEVVELESVWDSSGQIDTIDHHNVWDDDLPAVDDILSHEMPAGEEKLDSENREVDDKDLYGEDGVEIPAVKTKSFEEQNEGNGYLRQDNEEVREIRSLESGEEDEFYDPTDPPGCCVTENLAEKSKKRVIRKKTPGKKGRKMASEQKSEKKDHEIVTEAENSEDKENNEEERPLMEADILLSPDRRCEEKNSTSQKNDSIEIPMLKDQVQVIPAKDNSEKLVNLKVQETGGREPKIRPTRGLRQQTNSNDSAKPSKRLLDLFADESHSNKVPIEEKQTRRNTKGNKQKFSNSPVYESRSNDAPRSEREEDFQDSKNIEEGTALDNKSNKRVVKKKPLRKTRKARTSLVKIELVDGLQGSQSKQPGKRKRARTTKQTRKLSLPQNETGKIEKEMKATGEHDDIAQNTQVSPLQNEVKSQLKKKRGKKIMSNETQERDTVDNSYREDSKKKMLIEKKEDKTRRRKSLMKVHNVDDMVEIKTKDERGRQGYEDEVQHTDSPGKSKLEMVGINNHDTLREESNNVEDVKKRKTRKRPFASDDEEENVIRHESPEDKNVESACDGDSPGDVREEHSIEETIREEVTDEVVGEIKPALKKTSNEEDSKEQAKNAENKDESRKRKKNADLKSSNHPKTTTKMDMKGAEVCNDQDSSDASKSMRDNLKLKMRKSPEPKTNERDEEHNGVQVLNTKKGDANDLAVIDGESGYAMTDEQVEQANESKKTVARYEMRNRRVNLRSTTKSHEPEIKQNDNEIQVLNKKAETRVEDGVEFENNERNKSLCGNVKDGLKERKEKGKNTKASKRKSDSVAVNAAKKAKSKRGKKIEAIFDNDEGEKAIKETAVREQGEDGNEERAAKSREEDEKENCENETSMKETKRAGPVVMEEGEIKTEDKRKAIKTEGSANLENEDKENEADKMTNKRRRKKSVKNSIGDEVTNKRETHIPMKTGQQAKPVKKKRRTLCSNRENTTFINTTSSIFQETLSLNNTRSSTGMPPSLNAFMQAFIVPKLKKK